MGAERPTGKRRNQLAKTSEKRSAKKARYGVWRWYKPAQLRTDTDELLPISSLSNILALTNFVDLESLMAEINKHQAFEIPEALQKRLRRLFDLTVTPNALDREISVEIDSETFGVPYPFWPAPGSEDTELGVLMEPEVGHGEAEVYTRVQA